MNIRLLAAVLAARFVGWLSRMSGRGGSSLPGLIARRVYPAALRDLAARLEWGAILLTGTNGKTTTAAMIRHIIETEGRPLLSNRAGANLILGLTAALVQAERWRIRPRADIALLETDEATMPRAGEEIQPRLIIVTNFFRDQLDRYGELTTTVRYVARGIESLRPGGVLVLNADDPQAAQLGAGRPDVLYYGLEGEAAAPGSAQGYDALDARFCPRCGTELNYDRRYYAHLGHYHCSDCGWRRPDPHIAVVRWSRAEHEMWVRIHGQVESFQWRLPGIYNLYNEAAAIAAGSAMGARPAAIRESLANFRPAFGRMETLMAGDTRLWLALVKNPVGFNQVLSAVAEETQQAGFSVMIVINDRYADGRDVSWLWDVDFEHWTGVLSPKRWYVSGLRARDMAVRLKYAGVAPEIVTMDEDVTRILRTALSEAGGYTLYILPTYTAMLEVRQELTQSGLVRHFREG